jgi:hypothetical protein
MKFIARSLTVVLFLMLPVSVYHAQSGGSFEITSSVIASGGDRASGGDFVVDATIGQPIGPEYSRAPGFAVTPGFWTFTPLAPTAAGVTISGRIITADGAGLRNARLTLTGPNGPPRSAQSSGFGYYYFDDVPVGSLYVLTISSKRYTFAQPTLTILVLDSVSDADFVAEPLP